jgi:hypothetical protein
MTGGRRPITGRKPGDKRIRVERHHSPCFRYTGPGQLTAKAAASAPLTPAGRLVRSLASDPSMLQAVYVTTDVEEAEALRERWERQLPGVPLVIVESPYRALVGPVVTYLDVLDLAWPPDRETPTTIVVLPKYVAKHLWDRVLYNQAARRLKAALVGPRAHGDRRRAVSSVRRMSDAQPLALSHEVILSHP